MASSEHTQLADFIKNTHQNLRNDAKVLGVENAWKKHCADKNRLKEYAEAMRELATKHWEPNYTKEDSGIKSRVQWVYNFCDDYFFKGEVLKQRIREQDIAEKINLSVKIDPTTGYGCNKILKLLDVGSCYNPFKVFGCFDIVPIDIAPASEDVYRCDFLNLKIVDFCNTSGNKDNEIFELSQCMFDVVVFSLFLGYLPCPEQRLLCCIKAYELLKLEGLLIIITPDSKHVGANAKFMKSWRHSLAHLGFSRIKYDKLPHIHCMAFRKSIASEIANRWSKLQSKGEFYDNLYIPQDFNVVEVQDKKQSVDLTDDTENNMILLSELPNFAD